MSPVKTISVRPSGRATATLSVQAGRQESHGKATYVEIEGIVKEQ